MTNPIHEAASALGKLGLGIPKRLSDEERARRADSMRAAQKRRWAGHKKGK